MREVIADVEKKRFVSVLPGLDISRSLVGIPIVEQHRVGAVVDDLPIAIERKRRKIDGTGMVMNRPVVTERSPEIMVEPMVPGKLALLIAKMPLADHGRGIARFLEDFGQCLLVGIQSDGITWPQHPDLRAARQPDATRIGAGHDLCACGRAGWRAIVIVQDHSLCCQSIHVRRGVTGTETTPVAPAHIIHQDKNHVRFLRE